MLDLIKVIVLGFVEGVTEFLPVSSTGHLIVAMALLRPGFSETVSKTFEIFIQIGAIAAVVAYYHTDIWRQVRTVRTDRQVQHFWLAIVIAFVPVGAVGFLLRDFIDQYLQDSPALVAVSLIVGGVVLLGIERYFSAQKTEGADNLLEVSYRQAFTIGVIQVISLVPGVSRAAASIFGGMLSGLNRETATRFSFYLAIPSLGAATVFKLALGLKDFQSSDIVYLAVGTVVSAIVAWLAVGWLLRYISRHTFAPFGYYRIGAGIVILLLVAASVL